MRSKSKGFSLVELLVVLIIIGVLVALILPNTLRAINQAEVKECASNLRTIDSAIRVCYTETRDWDQCDTIAELSDGDYLDSEEEPACPFGVPYGIEDADVGNTKQSTKDTHFVPWPTATEHE